MVSMKNHVGWRPVACEFPRPTDVIDDGDTIFFMESRIATQKSLMKIQEIIHRYGNFLPNMAVHHPCCLFSDPAHNEASKLSKAASSPCERDCICWCSYYNEGTSTHQNKAMAAPIHQRFVANGPFYFINLALKRYSW